jgi:hypothetical protein
VTKVEDIEQSIQARTEKENRFVGQRKQLGKTTDAVFDRDRAVKT